MMESAIFVRFLGACASLGELHGPNIWINQLGIEYRDSTPVTDLDSLIDTTDSYER